MVIFAYVLLQHRQASSPSDAPTEERASFDSYVQFQCKMALQDDNSIERNIDTGLLSNRSSPISRARDNPDANPFTPAFASYMTSLLKEWNVPGISLSVIDNNDTYTAASGYATESSTPATPNTLYFCASTTKAFTAAALANLIDRG